MSEMSRKEAIDIIQAVKFIDDFGDYSDRLEIAIDMAIEALQDRPHGEWIESKERKGLFYCSECVHQDASGKWRELFDFKYNFCPNCGADMREGEAE